MSPYPRWQTNIINQALTTRRVLVLAGARQCGKTTLAKKLANPNHIYYTLDDLTILAAAKDDPQGFVRHDNQLMIIDEIQRAPMLLTSIKQNVDENTNPGRFLLTGSANIQSLPGVTESLAGRVRRIRLRPLSMGEIYYKEPNFISNAFKGEFISFIPGQQTNHKNYDKDAYLLASMHGLYPEALQLLEAKEIRQWYKDYLSSLIERDLKDIANIKRQNSIRKLIEVMAAWSSKFMDVATICSMLSLSRSTVETYINALETLYLIERLRPWHKTDYDRVSKQDKLFMTDAGLMSSILQWNFDKIRLNGEANGKLIETFVFTQLAAILDANEDNFELYHYRDREQREVDFIIENTDGDIIGIEVKAGSVVTKDNFKHLKWFRNNIVINNKFIGIVLYTGDHILPFGENLWAVPISCLWA